MHNENKSSKKNYIYANEKEKPLRNIFQAIAYSVICLFWIFYFLEQQSVD
jgi:hypothetical protein